MIVTEPYFWSDSKKVSVYIKTDDHIKFCVLSLKECESRFSNLNLIDAIKQTAIQNETDRIRKTE